MLLVAGGSLNTDLGPDSEAHISPHVDEADDMEPHRDSADKHPQQHDNQLADVDEKKGSKNGKIEIKTNTPV